MQRFTANCMPGEPTACADRRHSLSCWSILQGLPYAMAPDADLAACSPPEPPGEQWRSPEEATGLSGGGAGGSRPVSCFMDGELGGRTLAGSSDATGASTSAWLGDTGSLPSSTSAGAGGEAGDAGTGERVWGTCSRCSPTCQRPVSGLRSCRPSFCIQGRGPGLFDGQRARRMSSRGTGASPHLLASKHA